MALDDMLKSMDKPGVDWADWSRRWDRMQELYLPRREDEFYAVTAFLPFERDAAIRVLDVGCGPGSLMERIARAFPRAQLDGLDFDPASLKFAEKVLAPHGARCRFFSSDLNRDDWSAALQAGYDAIVSATTLHHFGRERRLAIYRECHGLLRTGGAFCNAGRVAAPHSAIGKLVDREYARYETNYRTEERGETFSEFWNRFGATFGVKDYAKHVADHLYNEDALLTLDEELATLRAAGFEGVDCIWKRFACAVFAGLKGAP